MEYGIQMYSVRDTAEKNLKEALQGVAELGYRFVEFAGFFDNPADKVKEWLDNFGLACLATHTALDKLTAENIEKTIEYHKAIGCERLIVPGCDWTSAEKCEKVLEALNFAEKELKKHGIRLGYHNHSREFFPTEDGIVFEDEIIKKTEVALELDTFWLFNAGIEVIEYLEKYKNRIFCIHLKDGIPAAEKDRSFEHAYDGVKGTSLGMGKAPVEAVKRWAEENGVPIIVESEGLEPTGMEEVKRCIEYLIKK